MLFTTRTKLQRAQNKVIRFILNKYSVYQIDVKDFQDLRILNISNRAKQLRLNHVSNWQVEQKRGGRGRGREWATLGVHPLSWLLSNNRLEKVPFVSVPHTSSNRLLLSNQDKDVPLVLLILLLFLLAPLYSTSGISFMGKNHHI